MELKATFFTKKDSKVIIGIFLSLVVLISFNLKISKRRGRDNIRKTDITSVQGALEKYLEKYRIFPESSNGKIVACHTQDTYFDDKEQRYMNLRECEWGEDGFENLIRLPLDPTYSKGRGYLYLSNTKHFQIFTSLEGKDESEYTESIALRNLKCGNEVCNFGKSYGESPLDISLEEYEEE